MKAVLEPQERNQSSASVTADVDELTVIRFERRKEAFDDIVNVLDADAIKQQQTGSNADQTPSRVHRNSFPGTSAAC
jgi:hypothetical protein